MFPAARLTPTTPRESVRAMGVAVGLLLAAVGGCDRQPNPLAAAVSPTSLGESVSAPAPAPSPPTAPTAPPVPPAPLTEAVLVGAGDIAECGQQGAVRTAALLDGIAGTVFTAGDNVYMNGTAKEFECYQASWGRHRSRTYPTTGNHDYGTPDASGYFQYFGERAGPMGQGYYSFEAGAWHVVSLNSNVAWREGSPQLQWLRRDLQQSPARCIAAIMHHPLVSSGPNGDNPHVRDLWRALQEAGADIVVAAHDHIYERHARLNLDGRPDPRGARLFTVGTGGARLYDVGGLRPTIEARAVVWGVIKFVLQPGRYRWEFHSVDGILDSGFDTCD